MTSLRGPDPYADAEAALARLFARQSPAAHDLCRVLHETVPTYSWVGLVRVDADEARLLAQHGAPRRAATLPDGCAALLSGATTLVVHDVATAAEYRGRFPEARALIAVPLGNAVVLVITSAHQGAFGLADRDLLAAVARRCYPAAATTTTTTTTME